MLDALLVECRGGQGCMTVFGMGAIGDDPSTHLAESDSKKKCSISLVATAVYAKQITLQKLEASAAFQFARPETPPILIGRKAGFGLKMRCKCSCQLPCAQHSHGIPISLRERHGFITGPGTISLEAQVPDNPPPSSQSPPLPVTQCPFDQHHLQ